MDVGSSITLRTRGFLLWKMAKLARECLYYSTRVLVHYMFISCIFLFFFMSPFCSFQVENCILFIYKDDLS